MSYTTVTAKLLTTSGAVPPDASFVKFQLRGYQPNLPKVVGTNVIVDSIEVDAYPDNMGVISIPLVDNQSIDPTGTFYHVSFFEGGVLFMELDWVITGAAVDLTTVPPSGGCPPSGPLPCNCNFGVAVSLTGIPLSGEVLIMFAMPNAVTFPAGLSGSIGIAGTPPTLDAIFTLEKNGVQFGTATFLAGETNAAFVSALEAIFAVGDILAVIAPTPADATLADISFTFLGK